MCENKNQEAKVASEIPTDEVTTVTVNDDNATATSSSSRKAGRNYGQPRGGHPAPHKHKAQHQNEKNRRANEAARQHREEKASGDPALAVGQDASERALRRAGVVNLQFFCRRHDRPAVGRTIRAAKAGIAAVSIRNEGQTTDAELAADLQRIEGLGSFFTGEGSPDNLLDSCILAGLPIHLGSMSDPLQPAEAEYHATREFLAVCQDYRQHFGITVEEILAAKYDLRQSPSSPRFFYRG